MQQDGAVLQPSLRQQQVVAARQRQHIRLRSLRQLEHHPLHMGSTSTRCQGAGVVTYSATSTNTTGITYSLNAASLTGGNTIDAEYR